MPKYTAAQITEHVWYIYDQKGNIAATLDDSGIMNCRSASEMERQATLMAQALNRGSVSNHTFVLCNSCGPVAVYDNEDDAWAMLCQVEDNEDQQNNSIATFTLNEDPKVEQLLA